MKNIGRLLRTIRYLKFCQIFYRVYYRIKKPQLPKIDFAKILISLRTSAQNVSWQHYNPRNNIIKSESQFTFLNVTRDISAELVWNDSQIPKLWLYNLHYFDYLLAPEHQLSVNKKAALIQRWIKENPSPLSVGWEPYPISLRIVNWIKFLISNAYSDAEIEKSLYIQAQLLSKRLEYHLLGNHLLANAKALIFAGLFFSGKQAEAWYRLGMKVYQNEILPSRGGQFLANGAHFELSPMYQAILLEDMLDILQIHRFYAQPEWAAGKALAANMLAWLQTMTHPDGHPAFFNDTAIGIAATYAQLANYAQAMGISPPAPLENTLTTSPPYFTFRGQRINLIFDAGKIGPDHLPAHGHADTLSFELSLDGQRIMVNSGTSCYDKSEDRIKQRSTAAHNTVVINQKNSSEMWGSFRVGRRANTHNIYGESRAQGCFMRATHDGYNYLGDVMHERSLQIIERELTITDHITGKHSSLTLEAYFHFHPDISIKQISEYAVDIFKWEEKIGHLKTNDRLLVFDSYYYPEFGKKIPNKTIKTLYEGKLPHNILSQFLWL